MAQTDNELTDYIIRLGEHVNLIYSQLDEVETTLADLTQEIAEVKDSALRTTEMKKLLPPIPETDAKKAVRFRFDAKKAVGFRPG